MVQPRRVPANQYVEEEEWDEYEGEEDEEWEDENMPMVMCKTCKDHYEPDDAGNCKECYNEAKKNEEGLKRQIEELKSKISFLSIDPPFKTDIVLLSSADAVPSSVPAHSFVLASRSPVFRAMLENEMKESRSGTIKIADASYDSLCEFVNYLYTAQAYLDNHMACSLLVLAEKYQVQHLKTHCEKYLISKMNWEKAIANYAFAHRHSADQLLDAALAIIIKNKDRLTENEDYVDLVQNNPRLVVEIYEAINEASHLAKQPKTASAPKP